MVDDDAFETNGATNTLGNCGIRQYPTSRGPRAYTRFEGTGGELKGGKKKKRKTKKKIKEKKAAERNAELFNELKGTRLNSSVKGSADRLVEVIATAIAQRGEILDLPRRSRSTPMTTRRKHTIPEAGVCVSSVGGGGTDAWLGRKLLRIGTAGCRQFPTRSMKTNTVEALP